jgi:hypothetical protein
LAVPPKINGIVSAKTQLQLTFQPRVPTSLGDPEILSSQPIRHPVESKTARQLCARIEIVNVAAININ